MKTKITFLIMALSLMSVQILSAETLPKAGQIALSIVIDTAWSNDNKLSDYRSLTRQGIAILKPGDYLEIITGHPGQPKLRAARFIKSGSIEELAGITAPINQVKCPIFSDVEISKAVALAFKRLVDSDAKKPFTHATVMVFSDGKLKDRDVYKLQQLAKKFKQRNWTLCVTGTYKTNQKLLVAANQGEFNFSLISDTNPVFWINTHRELTSIRSSAEPGTNLSDRHPEKDNNEFGYRANVETKVAITKVSGKDDQIPPAGTKDIKLEEKELNKPAVAAVKLMPVNPEPLKVKPIVKPEPAQKPGEPLKKLLWLVPLAIVVTVAILLFISGLIRAIISKPDIGSRKNKSLHKDPGTLVAKLNGQTHTLGREDRIGTIHIGSGPNNTIRIPDKSISDRHIRIYRKAGGLSLQNIGKTAVTVNSTAVKPNSNQGLTIPSIIEFDGKNRINLTLIRPKPAHQVTNQEHDHGTGQK